MSEPLEGCRSCEGLAEVRLKSARQKRPAIFIATILLAGCGTGPDNSNAVAADVLFLVLGKMALYDQSPAGEQTNCPAEGS